MIDWCRHYPLSIGRVAILSALAISSLYLIWLHLACNLDLYCGLFSFLVNDIAVFVSVLSTIVIYYIIGTDFTS